MSGLAGYKRTTASFGTNVAGSKAEMDKRKAGLYDKYNQNVRGVQDQIAFAKQKYLADSAQAIQEKVDQGKQLAETAVGGAMVQGGIKSGIGMYRTAQAARTAKLSADAAKAARATKAASGTEGNEGASVARTAAGEGDEVTAVVPTTNAVTATAPESSFGSLGTQDYGSGIAVQEQLGGAQASETAQATTATTEGAEAAEVGTVAEVGEGAETAATGAASLLGTASSAATAAAEGVSAATATLGAASDAITAGVGEAAESGGMSLLPSLLAAGGVEESVAAGVMAAAPEIGGAIILGSTLAYGLYDVFHHGAPNAPPKMPELPTYNAGPGVSTALVKARNQFTTPSFDSVIDTPAASAAF
tara:strand:+ start:3132 stop:4214 length:1083 start_codon:yes stop_codon:yes gene_type:complete